MRVFDFDGTIYDGESLFDFYLFSVRYEPRVLRFLAPVLGCGIEYRLGRAKLDRMERRLGSLTQAYLRELSGSERLRRLDAGRGRSGCGTAGPAVTGGDDGLGTLLTMFWDRRFDRIKSWYEPRPDDVIVTASFDLTVHEACRRLGVRHLVASTVVPETLEVSYLNFNTNKPKRFRELYGDAAIDEFYTDSRFDQPMIDMARTAYLVKGDRITRIK